MTLVRSNEYTMRKEGALPLAGKKTVKFSLSSRSGDSDRFCDSSLQAGNRKRKYMRRGSKSPSMLNLQKGAVDYLESLTLFDSAEKEGRTSRRYSLMTALKISLECTGLETKSDSDRNKFSLAIASLSDL